MIQVKVGPRKIVYVKCEPDNMGVYCTFYPDNTEDFPPLGNKYVHLPRGYSKEMLRRAEESAAKEYFS